MTSDFSISSLNEVKEDIFFRIRNAFMPFDISTGPLFSNSARKKFEENLTRSRLYVEFGAGGSTVLAMKLNIETISIESDKSLIQRLVTQFKTSGKDIYRPIHKDVGFTGRLGFPMFRKYSKQKGYCYSSLDCISSDWKLIDLVLIDGRWRMMCFCRVIKEVYDRDLDIEVIFDDFEGRGYYQQALSYVDPDWVIDDTAGFRVNRQTIKMRPNEECIDRYAADPR